MNLALQASVSSAPGLGGGRGERGERGEAMAVLPFGLVAGGAGAAVPPAFRVDAPRGGPIFGLSCWPLKSGFGFGRARASP